jgi:hypothetical protein
MPFSPGVIAALAKLNGSSIVIAAAPAAVAPIVHKNSRLAMNEEFQFPENPARFCVQFIPAQILG